MKITWYGHSCFRIELAGATILVDPFLTGNPTAPVTAEAAARGVTHVIASHGHDDHIGDVVAVCRASGAQLTANFEICMWASGQGIQTINPMNAGGTVDVGPFAVTLTIAHHSSASLAGGGPAVYLGNPHGVVLRASGEKTLYYAGDTDIFTDMGLIAELYQPEIGILPIGDRFTMGARTAAFAARRFFRFSDVLPCHYRTFGLLDQSADAFVQAMDGSGMRVHVPEPGGTVIL